MRNRKIKDNLTAIHGDWGGRRTDLSLETTTGHDVSLKTTTDTSRVVGKVAGLFITNTRLFSRFKLRYHAVTLNLQASNMERGNTAVFLVFDSEVPGIYTNTEQQKLNHR